MAVVIIVTIGAIVAVISSLSSDLIASPLSFRLRRVIFVDFINKIVRFVNKIVVGVIVRSELYTPALSFINTVIIIVVHIGILSSFATGMHTPNRRYVRVAVSISLNRQQYCWCLRCVRHRCEFC